MGFTLAVRKYVDIILEARQTIQYCYAWRYYAASSSDRYESWIGELEAIAEALEAALNLELFAEVAPESLVDLQRQAEANSEGPAAPEAENAFLGCDVRKVFARGATLHCSK